MRHLSVAVAAATDAISAAVRVAGRDGFRRVVSRGVQHATDYWQAHRFLRAADCLPATASPAQIVDLVFSNKSVRPLQIRSEILRLSELVQECRPRTLLEIGTAAGGTFFIFCRCAASEAHLISVDLPEGAFGGGYRVWRETVYRRFAAPQQTVRLIRADSHTPATLERVIGELGGKPLDFLFIDGDHTYEGVKRDFEMYHPLVRKGGLIAIHDIVKHPPSVGCEVDRFWAEIRTRCRSEEIVENPDQKTKGIGVVWV